MKQDLIHRYHQEPAKFGIFGKLPLTWQELDEFKQEQEWSERVFTNALQEYYKHKIHTAWRFLTSPNNWMDPAYVIDAFGNNITYPQELLI